MLLARPLQPKGVGLWDRYFGPHGDVEYHWVDAPCKEAVEAQRRVDRSSWIEPRVPWADESFQYGHRSRRIQSEGALREKTLEELCKRLLLEGWTSFADRMPDEPALRNWRRSSRPLFSHALQDTTEGLLLTSLRPAAAEVVRPPRFDCATKAFFRLRQVRKPARDSAEPAPPRDARD